MKSWYIKDELKLFRRMLYAFSFSTLSCILCGIDTLNLELGLQFNAVIAVLSELFMLAWIFARYPDPKIRGSIHTIYAVARICTVIGLIFVVFSMIGNSHLLHGFILLASFPYLIVGACSWILYFMHRKELYS